MSDQIKIRMLRTSQTSLVAVVVMII